MISDIRLQNYRSYADESFEFDPGVNIIVGPNASGKTNLLEAILVSCLNASYRVRDADLIMFDSDWARLDAHTDKDLRITKLKRAAETVKKELFINQQPVKRMTLQKTVPVVLFEPNHLLLLTGAPDLRRDYTDNLLGQLIVGFDTIRRHYRRALAQRNSLLKAGGSARSQLFAWNIRLSQIGGQIARERLVLIDKMNEHASGLYQLLSGDKSSEVEFVYRSHCPAEQYESELLHKLEAGVETDLQRGFTAYGPHRDDIQVKLNGHLMQDTASRGETRSLLLIMKMLELKLIEEQRAQKPILLLDDVFSELDGARRRALTEALKDHQTFITTTDADIVVQQFMGNCRVIPLQRSEK